MANDIGLVVMTAHRGVFFGYGQPADTTTVTLKLARMCLYWPETVKGSFGLAVTGPIKGSKVGPAVPEVTLRDVTAVLTCTPQAVRAWEAQPWS